MTKLPLLFTIEPYVYISVKGYETLLYNSLTGKFLHYKDNKSIARFVERLGSKKNLGVLKLSRHYLQRNPIIHKFVLKLRKHYFGDLMGIDYQGEKPVQLMPMLNIQRDVKKLLMDSEWSTGEDIKTYLSEATFFINNCCRQNCTICSGAYKHFTHCHRGSISKELALSSIKNLIVESVGSSLSKINITGGDISMYSELGPIIKLLNSFPISKCYHTHYLNLPNIRNVLPAIAPETSSLKVSIHFPLDGEAFSKTLKLLDGFDVSFDIVIRSEAEYSDSQAVIETFDLPIYSIRPFYTGKNGSFFRKYVYLKKTTIYESRPTLKDIYSRIAINPLDFGALTILSNGNVHANVNSPMVGKIHRDSLYEIIFRELLSGNSWRRIRKSAQPCKKCVYEAICPPLSNYEHVIGKNNLCSVWKDSC